MQILLHFMDGREWYVSYGVIKEYAKLEEGTSVVVKRVTENTVFVVRETPAEIEHAIMTMHERMTAMQFAHRTPVDKFEQARRAEIEKQQILQIVLDNFPSLREYSLDHIKLAYNLLWAMNETIAKDVLAAASLLRVILRQPAVNNLEELFVEPDLILHLRDVR